MPELKNRSLDGILKHPLTEIRQAVSEHYMRGEWKKVDYPALYQKLKEIVPADLSNRFQEQLQIAQASISTGTAGSAPDISNEYLELLWGLHSMQYRAESGQSVRHSKLWEQLTSTQTARDELLNQATIVAKEGISRNTRIRWGDMNTMFYHSPTEHMINMDFAFSLIVGLDNSRSIMSHEIGHSKRTRDFPEKQREVYKQVVALQEKVKKGSITKEDYEKLINLSAEFRVRHRVFDESENSPVNRYTMDKSTAKQDYAYGLNQVEVTVAQADQTPLPQDSERSPKAEFRNINRALRMSTYMRNELFENTDDAWERIGVRTDWIRELPTPANDNRDMLAYLIDLGKQLEDLQPSGKEKFIGNIRGNEDWFEALIQDYQNRRNAVIEEMWEHFQGPFAEKMLEATKKQIEEELKDQSPDDMIDVDGEKKPNPGTPPETPQEAEQQKRQKQQSGESQSGGESQDGGQTIDEVIEQKEPSPSEPEKGEPQSGKTKPSDGAPNGAGSPPSRRGIPQSKQKQAAQAPVVGDWKDYHQTKGQFLPQIRRAERIYERLQEKHYELVEQESPNSYSLTPVDGSMGRFEEKRYTDLVTKVVTGRSIGPEDAKLFRDNAEMPAPAVMDTIILVDGSGSMYNKKGKHSPIDAGVHVGCVTHEATKKLENINVHLSLWGSQKSLMLVSPGENAEASQKKISGMNKSNGWPSKLAPSLKQITDVLSKQRIADGHLHGNSHLVVVSDGDIDDQSQAGVIAQKLMEVPKLTIDIVVINPNQNTAMAKFASTLQAKFGERVRLAQADTAEASVDLMMGLLQQRASGAIKEMGMEPAKKAQHFRKAYESMKL